MTQILPIKFQEHLQVGNAFPTTFIITNHQHQHSQEGNFKFELLETWARVQIVVNFWADFAGNTLSGLNLGATMKDAQLLGSHFV